MDLVMNLFGKAIFYQPDLSISISVNARSDLKIWATPPKGYKALKSRAYIFIDSHNVILSPNKAVPSLKKAHSCSAGGGGSCIGGVMERIG
jgi:hypothetical protein